MRVAAGAGCASTSTCRPSVDRPRASADDLIRAGLEVETVEQAGADVTGPLVVGRVLEFVDEPQKNGKTIRWCQVDVGERPSSRGIVCGARNFAVGDLVVVALPGAVLPGDFAIAARKTYGHVSDGMICSARELGLGDDHDGIMVLRPGRRRDPGDDAAPVLRLRDDVLDIAVTPDRGYCLSHPRAGPRGGAGVRRGVHRSGRPPDCRRGRPTATRSRSTIRRPARCSSRSRVTGIDPTGPARAGWRRRVQLAGMRSISLAVDVTNYVMLETGPADPRATTRTGWTGRSWSAGRPTARS